MSKYAQATTYQDVCDTVTSEDELCVLLLNCMGGPGAGGHETKKKSLKNKMYIIGNDCTPHTEDEP